MEVLGIRIDNLSREETLEKIEGFLAGNKLCQIATINPEFILAAQKDEEFKSILNSCDLNIADGVGIKFAFWKLGFQKLKTRIAGVDLMEEILKIANGRGLGVYLVANKDGLSTWEETRDAILKKYPNLKIEGINIDKHTSGYRLQVSGYGIVFCNFGAPFQEKFLHSLKSQENGKIKLAMGVGGSFDYLTGKVKRAPRRMRQIGLEWLFRLIQQPNRICRILNATIIFPIKIIFNNNKYDSQSQVN
ncbi:MAG: WecB/TagA/CpsF family glycosyltransferase [Parcubacteria group bacterium]